MVPKIYFCRLKSKKKEKYEALSNRGIGSNYLITTDWQMKLQKWIDRLDDWLVGYLFIYCDLILFTPNVHNVCDEYN
jgi:hypothetical protein